MKKRAAILLALLLCVLLCACSAKLTTVRPAEISTLRLERVSDGAVVTLPDSPAGAERKDILIFQLEEPYERVGACADTDEHYCRASLYILDKLDTEVIINADGTVCKGGGRYAPTAQADAPVNLDDWSAAFAAVQPAQTGEAPPAQPEPQLEPQPGAQPGPQPEIQASQNKTTELGSATVVAAQGSPQPLPPGADIGVSYPVAEVGPWSYYTGEVTVDGQAFAMLWRDNARGDAQWLMCVEQPMEDPLWHSISYDGGAAESGGRFLYFTLCDALNYHRSLWVLDTQSDHCNLFYETPCSNLVIPQDPPPDYVGLGWIVYDTWLIPIDLDAGREYTGGIIDLTDYYDVLGETLFFGIGDWGTHKYVRLADLGDHVLEIQSVTAQPEDTDEELIDTHQLDYLMLAFW